MDPIKTLLQRYRLRPGDLGFTTAAELEAWLKQLYATYDSEDDVFIYRSMLVELIGMELAVVATRPDEFTAPGQLTVRYDRVGIMRLLLAERGRISRLLEASTGGATGTAAMRASRLVLPEEY
ncbi:hypothetical protein [Deinococcus fonticola]|uniref:hypothetical protein n=1 Tax=Deinococcus fonticola TaxID=2528713 RepID=UPI001074C570|nr:hypothetical protein [Deinococcus fonticola]